MADFNDVLQSLVNEDYDTLAGMAKVSLGSCTQVVAKFTSQEKAAGVVLQFLSAVLAVDGSYSALEQKFVADVFGDSDGFVPMLKSVDAQTVEMLDSLIDRFNAEDKSSFIMLAAAVCAVDETISRPEVALLKKLLD